MNSKSKHPIHILKKISSKFIVQKKQGFRIGRSMAAEVKLIAYFEMIIYLSVKDDGIFFIKMHGLFTACNIKNRKPQVKELNIARLVTVLLIGPAVMH